MVPPSSSGRTPAGDDRRRSEPVRIELAIDRPLTPREIAVLFRRVLGASDAGGPIECTLLTRGHCDVATVDALARIVLTARRAGRPVRFHLACDDLRDLVTFLGLDAVVAFDAASGVEPGRQSEHREQGVGVEEEGDPGDPAV